MLVVVDVEVVEVVEVVDVVEIVVDVSVVVVGATVVLVWVVISDVVVESVDLIFVSFLLLGIFVSSNCVPLITVCAENVGSGSIPKSAQSGVEI